MKKISLRTMAALLSCTVILLVSAARPVQVAAGAFVFSDQPWADADTITHPFGYSGSGGELEIRVGIDPSSPHAQSMVVPVRNIIFVFNNLELTVGNLVSGSDNNIPVNGVDFESVALHEMGHALGLAHPNLATESGLSGANQNYTKSTTGSNNSYSLNSGPDGIIGSADDLRGDDENLHWFNLGLNDPFELADTVDTRTYSRPISDLPAGDSFAVNADRNVADQMGYPDTEAVMQQGTFSDEAQRTLVADDIATLRLAGAGLDETAGTSDDYTFRLVYAGLTTDADIVLKFDNNQTTFAVTRLSATWLTGSHWAVTSSPIYFNTGANWFFNTEIAGQAAVYVESGASCGGKTPCYETIQEALNDAATKGSATTVSIQVADGTYTEAPVFNAPGKIIFDGGWSADFATETQNHVRVAPGPGAVIFSKGSSVVDGMTIQ